MAIGLPVLERERTNERTRGHLAAYGKLSGGAGNEADPVTEEQRAQSFNSQIAENYQKLMDPSLHSAAEIMGLEEPVAEEQPRVYDTPEAYARAMLYPERERPVAMPTRRIVDTQPEYRPQSAMNMQPAMAAPVLTPERETFAPSYAAPSYAAPAYAEPAYAEPQAPVSPISVQETYAVPEYADEAAEAYAEEENEDLAPTATTIQYRTEQRARDDKRTLVEEKRGHAMTTQGKLLMAIYAVVVVVILALIIINTSVLRNLDASIAENRAALFAATEQAQQLQDEIDYLTSEESIIDRAESELGMVRG